MWKHLKNDPNGPFILFWIGFTIALFFFAAGYLMGQADTVKYFSSTVDDITSICEQVHRDKLKIYQYGEEIKKYYTGGK